MAVREIARRLTDGVWRTVDIAEDGGGGQQAPLTALFSGDGSPTSCNSGEFTRLPWVQTAGDSFLDFTNPTFPAATIPGIWSFAGQINIGGSSHANKTALGRIELADGALTLNAMQPLDPDIFSLAGVYILLAAIYPVAAAETVQCLVYHEVGSPISASLSGAIIVNPS